MINVRTHPSTIWKCEVCENRRRWQTAWGMQPILRCDCEDWKPNMDFESAIPKDSSWVYNEEDV